MTRIEGLAFRFRDIAKMNRARKLAGWTTLCRGLKFSAFMNSFISYNLRFQIPPFAIRSCSERSHARATCEAHTVICVSPA